MDTFPQSKSLLMPVNLYEVTSNPICWYQIRIPLFTALLYLCDVDVLISAGRTAFALPGSAMVMTDAGSAVQTTFSNPLYGCGQALDGQQSPIYDGYDGYGGYDEMHADPSMFAKAADDAYSQARDFDVQV